ncbi:RNA polymerase sigma factor, sigma-70 family [Verrucomicrobiia bacterium DG1235]|nr:RNA polymerase sigma factor, sigma-70 family [Verrucomicrobiae bacterium DG1235]
MQESEQRRILDDWLDQHRGLLFKVVRAYASKQHDQEDLFQEIATQVWNSIPKFRGDSKVSTWIYRVAFYSAIAWSKKEKKHKAKHSSIDDYQPLLQQATAAKNPRLDWLYDQIGQLDEIDRSLTLMMLDGYSYKEISTTLGLSESNVGVKLNRIKKHLSEKSKETPNNEF